MRGHDPAESTATQSVFAASLGRYLDVRRRYPDAAMMMGVGNLTELTEVDSAGANVMFLGFCQELGIRSVLTTRASIRTRTVTSEGCAASRTRSWQSGSRSCSTGHEANMFPSLSCWPAATSEIGCNGRRW